MGVSRSRSTAVDDIVRRCAGNAIRRLTSANKVTLSKSSAFECGAEKVAAAPDQPAPTHRAEIVERNSKAGWHDVQAVQSNAGSVVSDVTDAARMNARVTHEKHQRPAINNGAAL